jgi:hypothetical protein
LGSTVEVALFFAGGVGLRLLVVDLLIYHHVPAARWRSVEVGDG